VLPNGQRQSLVSVNFFFKNRWLAQADQRLH
jgi:hypothetical protein